MPNVKIAISLDEDLYEQGEQLAEELALSRSKLYATALEAYIQKHKNQRIMRDLNAVYGEGIDPDDKEFLKRARQHLGSLLKDDEW